MSPFDALRVLQTPAQVAVAPCVDVSFTIQGDFLPVDYPFALMTALVRFFPWLEHDLTAGVHPIRAPLTEAGYVVSRRSRLQLRVPESHIDAVSTLEGQSLMLGSTVLCIGAATLRPVLPFPTLRASMVVNSLPNELAFVTDLGRQLDVLGVKGELICGKPAKVRAGDRSLTGFAVVLHGLSIEHSVRIQRSGIGPSRLLGCGLFVHHKVIDGLDAFPE